MDSILASHPAAPGSNPSTPKNFSEQILKLLRVINSTALNSGQRLDNVDPTHLVLASGKLVLQKVVLDCGLKIGLRPAGFDQAPFELYVTKLGRNIFGFLRLHETFWGKNETRCRH